MPAPDRRHISVQKGAHMFCSNCGHKMNETDKFCESCGSPAYSEEADAPVVSAAEASSEDPIPNLEKKIMKNMENELLFDMPVNRGNMGQNAQDSMNQEPPQYEHIPPRKGSQPAGKKEKKKINKWIIILSVFVAVLVLVLAIMAFVVSKPTNKLKSVIKDRDWAQAETIYEKSFKGNDKKEAQADALFSDAVQKIESEFTSGSMDYQTAKRHLSAIADFWDDSCVQNTLNRIQQLNDSRTAFEEAEKYMEDKNYKEAIRKYGEIIKSDSNYEEAQSRLETARSKYKDQILRESQAYEELKDYDAAIEQVEDALSLMLGDKDLQERLEDLQEAKADYAIQSVLDQAERYAAQGNYYSAMDLLKNTLVSNSGNQELKAASEDYRKKYEEDILKKAETALGTDENYEAALIVLDSALNTLGGDYPEIEQSLKNKREEYVQAQLEKSQLENAAGAVVGSWHATRVSSNGIEMSAQSFLIYSGMAGTSMRMEFYSTGSFHIDLLGESGDGVWRQDNVGSNTYLLDIGGDVQAVQMNESGKLVMNLDGVVLTFEKEVSA